jgi:hypothetical protein
MIRKFATVPRVVPALIVLTILVGATTVLAQQDPAPQTPAQQSAQQPSGQQPAAQQTPESQSGSQEASPEESIPRRRIKPKGYNNWAINVGGGASLTSGTTMKYVRSGGLIGAAGIARNANKYLGLRLDFQVDNLPLRASALQLAQAPGASSHVYTVALGPIINIPVSKDWGGYIVGGGAYFHRTDKLDSSNAIPGSACNGVFQWLGSCYAGNLPSNGKFLNASVNQFGEEFGAGVTRTIRPHLEFYAEVRMFHGSHNNITTDFRPITVGLRW